MMKKRSINLVKAAKNPVRVKRQLDKIYIVLNTLVAVMLLAVALTAVILNSMAASNREQIKKLDDQIQAIERQIAAQAEYKATYQFLKKYNEDMRYVLDIIQLSPAVSEQVFSSIEEALPGDVELSKFKMDSGVIYISAYAILEESLMDYVDRLRLCGVFSAVSWKNSISLGEDNKHFIDLSLFIKGVSV